MSAPFAFVAACGIGFVAGLRTFTAPAAASWLAWTRRPTLAASAVAFMGSTAAVALFTLAAIGELVADKHPRIPSRTRPGPFAARLVSGALSGATLSVGAGESMLGGGMLGALGALIGTVCGYQVRTKSVKKLRIPDLAVALAEDAIAVAGALLFAFGSGK